MMHIVLALGTAAVLLVSARVFLLPYLVWGPQAFDGFSSRADHRIIAGGLAAAAIALVSLPVAASVLITPTPVVQVSA